jgi:hypothetical protein
VDLVAVILWGDPDRAGQPADLLVPERRVEPLDAGTGPYRQVPRGRTGSQV